MRWRHFIRGGPLFIAVAGCSTFEGLSLSKEASRAGTAKCHHAGLPPRSELATLNAPELDLVFAVKSLDFGDGTDGMPRWEARTVGFDLDETCTGEGEGPTCIAPPGAGIAQLDGRDGQDNAAGTLKPLNDAGGAVADPPNGVAKLGGAAAVYRISGYNGLSVDGAVEVAAYAAHFVATGDAKSPLWLGDDVWSPYVDWVDAQADAGDAGAPFPTFKSSDAYVTNGTLVATFDLVMGLPAVRFSGAMLEAKIERDDEDSWTLSDGVFAGRTNADDTLQFIVGQIDPETGKAVCRDSKSYEVDKLRACALADIRVSGNDPSKPCDAISWAWKFDAVAAHLSSQTFPASWTGGDGVVRVDPCSPEVSPASDHCDR